MYYIRVAEGVNELPSGIGSNNNSSDPLCPSPEPLIRNTNSDIAVLMSDSFNGTQPVHAGNYTCYSNGLPRATVEVVVLGMSMITL